MSSSLTPVQNEKHSTSKSDVQISLSEHSASQSPENINVTLANPLLGLSHDQLIADGDLFAKSHNLDQLAELFQKGALVAQDPLAFESLPLLTDEDKAALRREIDHKWSQPKMLYYLVIMCSVAAAVQGMDESVINGANLFFAPQFGIDPKTGDQSRNQWLLGLVNSAPYFSAAGSQSLYFGRRGTIFITATFSFLTCIWQGLTNSWQHLFVARFFLGIGIGPKSATVPVYAAECAPPAIRGALVMMWQTWTAFGIMLGFVADLAFFRVSDKPHITGLNWRLMLSSAGIPALLIMVQVFFCPESPRWYVSKGRYDKAYESLAKLRHSPIQAARDLYYIHVLLEAEKKIQRGHNRFLELFKVPRNRRATLASFIAAVVSIDQNLHFIITLTSAFPLRSCGVNVIAYYSSNIFAEANFSQIQALLASFGFGAINFVFAFPAIYTIDTFGRRNLLLTTFPLMAIFLLMTGFALYVRSVLVLVVTPNRPTHGSWIPEDSKARIAVVALGIYLFGMAYSPGAGPVPFTYSAEAFPLYVRDIGMSFATAILWFFNFVISITFPRLLGAFQPQGAFGWYAAWNIFGFVAVLFFVPETKALSLEELDEVFSVPTRIHAAYQLKVLPHNIKKYIYRMNVPDLPPLYEHEKVGKAIPALDWCKSTAPGRTQSAAFRLGIASFTENYSNRIAIVGLQDDRVLVEDDYTDYPDFVMLCEDAHGYPATSLQWQPASGLWSQNTMTTELLATTGDALRVYEYNSDGAAAVSNYVGRQPSSSGHSLSVKTALSGQSKVQTQSTGAPLTNFSWNEKAPSLIVTSSIDTTCTVWNIETSTAITQLIAHDREVYDVAWLPGSTDIFVSVGADGSLRAFDLRSLEHSTILYETPTPKNVPPPSASPSSTARPPTSPLLRIAFNPSDSNYMSTFHMDGSDVQILDMRSPGQPVMELRGHHAPINAFGWGSAERPLLATAGDDCQLLLWDLANYNTPGAASPRSTSARLNSPRPDTKKRIITEPVMAYTASTQITNLAWSPQLQGMSMGTGHSTVAGEWVAIASGKTIKALKV
ncbi:DDB1- and CUL4-associated factor 7 [Hypsizygus marmoreus]|uniref:DDB1- and CUL4-associated factor 7 n=1 Tax=Hypsizygus marmoreus TaxID=39966 RepID=A0A369JSP9_HYPMA|nr:DDB1- and CUL4-associated factor 7 [Hypsizygus marmoreus]